MGDMRRRLSVWILPASYLLSACDGALPESSFRFMQNDTALSEQGANLRAVDGYERLFEGAYPIDASDWDTRFASEATPALPAIRQELVIKEGRDHPVCQAIALNASKFGGVFEGGCSAYPVALDHPKANEFVEPVWSAVNAKENLHVIRQHLIDACTMVSGQAIGLEESSPECWRQVALGYRRAADDGRLAIELAEIDLDGDGATEQTYRYAIRSRNMCYAHDGTLKNRWRYALKGDGHFARSFNRANETGALFVYTGDLRNTAYFWNSPNDITYGFSVSSVDASGTPLGREYGNRQICTFK